MPRNHTIDLAAIGIESSDLADLETPFTDEEVLAAVKDVNGDKAPGPDGFT